MVPPSGTGALQVREAATLKGGFKVVFCNCPVKLQPLPQTTRAADQYLMTIKGSKIVQCGRGRHMQG